MNIKFKKELYITLLVTMVLLIINSYMENGILVSLIWVGIALMITSLLAIARGWFGLSVIRNLPTKRLFSGDTLNVEVEFLNTLYLPFLCLKIRENLPQKYIEKNQQKLIVEKNIDFIYKKKQMKYQLIDIPRGLLRWENVEIKKVDIFGLLERSKRIDTSGSIIVYPRYVDMSIELLFDQSVDNQRTKKAKSNDFSQISGVREYQRGDKLSLIHWKVSARKNQLMSKQFYPLLTHETHIVLDCYTESFRGLYNEEFELAVSVTASLVNSLARAHKELTLKINDNEKNTIKYKTREYFLARSMEKLALVEPRGETSLIKFIYQNYYNSNQIINLFIVTNSVNKELLNHLLSKSNIKAKIFLVCENQDASIELNHIVTRVGNLEQLKKPKRSVANG